MLASMWISKHSDSWSDILMYFALWLWTNNLFVEHSMILSQLEHMKWSWGHVYMYIINISIIYHQYPFREHFVCPLMDPRGCQDMLEYPRIRRTTWIHPAKVYLSDAGENVYADYWRVCYFIPWQRPDLHWALMLLWHKYVNETTERDVMNVFCVLSHIISHGRCICGRELDTLFCKVQ